MPSVTAAYPCGVLLILFICLSSIPTLCAQEPDGVAAPVPANFRRANLVAWCIVPFDAKERTPEARAEMLVDLGLKRCAYDWRNKHVPTFEREINAYKKNGIEFTAFWRQHDQAFKLFDQYDLHPEIWTIPGSPEVEGQQAKITRAVAELIPLVEKCAKMNCKLGLYNHGGWSGEPANLVAICETLQKQGHRHVGIIYNFHHAHDQLDTFAESFAAMKPWLLCLNLNGMVDLKEFTGRPQQQREMKIRPLGSGQFEQDMIRTVIDAGYEGPVGIIGHNANRDVRDVLTENLEGLEYLLGQRKKPSWLERLNQAEYLAKWTPQAREQSKFAYEKETDDDWVDGRFSKMDTGPTFCNSMFIPVRLPNSDDHDHGHDHDHDHGNNNRDEEPGRRKITKAIAIRAAGRQQGHLLFDSETAQFVAAWSGDFVNIPSARYGLLQIPSIAGTARWLLPRDARWQIKREGKWSPTASSDIRFSSYQFGVGGVGLNFMIGQTSIGELTTAHQSASGFEIHRSLSVKNGAFPCRCPLMAVGETTPEITKTVGRYRATAVDAKSRQSITIFSDAPLQVDDGLLFAILEHSTDKHSAGDENSGGRPAINIRLVVHKQGTPLPVPENDLTERRAYPASIRPATKRWGAPIELTGQRSNDTDAAFVIDTIPVPLENQHRALMFVSGLDFLGERSAYVCTVHGDVWRVDGIDDNLDRVTWTRYATGLYQPLGLVIVDGDPLVMCRDRITRLKDLNHDGEADLYATFNDDLVLTGQPHGYAMGLERDPQGNFYFIKSGAAPPHGGTLLKLSKDGKDLSVFATGYRHANGIGVSPTGVITSADNEGNWIPSTRLDVVRQGGFYGHMPTHRRKIKPDDYDPPLCWMPRAIDNSAGGQTWVTSDSWRAIAGKMIHFSFGRCTANVVLPQKVGDVDQAAVYRLDIPEFLSGSMRGRFNPADGHLYVGGLDGWQTAATQDGHFQRIRATGKPFYQPTDFRVLGDRIEISFDVPLNRKSVETKRNWQLQRWNYSWTGDYGSDHFSVTNPGQVGHDDVRVSSVKLSSDQKTVRIFIPDLAPVMQMSALGKVQAQDGHDMDLQIYNTINK